MRMISGKIANNAKWIIGCKIVQAMIQMVVGMITARYLGPANYGLINYATAVVSFAIPVMQLGLPSTLVQEYVDAPEAEGQTMGTALVMNLIAALASMAAVAAFVAVANPGERTTLIVCVLYSVSLIFQSTEMLRYWFQAKLLSKYSSLGMLCAHLLVAVYKIILLITGSSVYWFALVHAVEYCLAGILYLLAYRKKGVQKLSFSLGAAKRMLMKSRHYIAAMLMVVLFNRTGNVMLKQFWGEAELGFFSAAVTCTCITDFVFGAIIDTARPVILQSRQISHEVFEKNVARVYAITTWLSLAQSIFFTIFARPVIWVLYGQNYLPAVPVLQILIWFSAFSYMGYVRDIWILAEERHSILFKINAGGVAVSLVLNFALIPKWGACGAAVASVLTQIFTNVVMGFLLPSVRANNRLLMRGIHPNMIKDGIKELGCKLKSKE